MSTRILVGDCRDHLPMLGENSVESIVTDPPYHFASIIKRFGADNAKPVRTGVYERSTRGFMGKTWDGGSIAFDPNTWAAVLRVLKPGGHMVAFGAPKNAHRLTCAIEDAGFEIRDCLMWIFGSGFPKSHDVSKGIDKMLGAERVVTGAGHAGKRALGAQRRFDSGYRPQLQDNADFDITAPATPESAEWDGWGTALKPAYEPIILARKPLSEGTVAANVLRWGTGAINIDGCRVDGTVTSNPLVRNARGYESGGLVQGQTGRGVVSSGRWPANLIHDGSEEVLAAFPADRPGGRAVPADVPSKPLGGVVFGQGLERRAYAAMGDYGSAARFFYSAKADKSDRAGSKHPTVKPIALMRWLCRLITPKGGTILDPFAGSGTTGQAALAEGFSAILIEREAEYVADIKRRMANVDGPLFAHGATA